MDGMSLQAEIDVLMIDQPCVNLKTLTSMRLAVKYLCTHHLKVST